MDASCYAFLNDIQLYYLHLAVDDATGVVVVGAYLDTQETLKGYFNILNQILNNYDIPHAFLTDRRTVFEKQEDCSVNNYILAVLKPSVIASDHSIKYKNNYYFPINRECDKVYFNYKTQCLVMACFDGKLCVTAEDEIYLLEDIPLHKKYSSQLDITTPKKDASIYHQCHIL